VVRGRLRTPEENGAGWSIGDIVVVRAQLCLLVGGAGAEAQGVLNQSGAVEARGGIAAVNVGCSAIGDGQSSRYPIATGNRG